MMDLWNSLPTEAQVGICTLLSGIVLWAVQKYWTNATWLPWLGPDSSSQKKRLAAVLFALAPGLIAIAATHKIPDGFIGVIFALIGSQVTHKVAMSGEE